ncbi:MAG: 50S ribosomal protein L18e [Methanomicrobiales archaeon]|nr:50S ribosomal protein L18e [Methanomicrobiales archaeon]
MKRVSKKTNPRLTNLIDSLKKAARENQANIWSDIASKLEAPSRNRAEVNLSKISRYAIDGETILVPGKVLGSGLIDQPVRVAAFNFSRSATMKIREAKGTCMSIEELLRANPEGSRIRILR